MNTGSPVYALLLVAGIVIGTVYWVRVGRTDSRLLLIYFAGLACAFLGAKAAFLLAEGWLYQNDPNRWTVWLSGKSIVGALPGGWLGVELAKRLLDYRAITGDRFAMLLPVPLILGRVGCHFAGCCRGSVFSFGQWPAVQVEIGFQLLALGGLWVLRRRRLLAGQHFHLYLVGYGVFRFAHEFLRATPKPFLGLSGYQILSLATAAAALAAFSHRQKSNAPLC